MSEQLLTLQMAELALQATLQVLAGVLPEQPDPILTRQWHFTRAEIEANDGLAYCDAQGAALHYAATLMDPQHVTWVCVEWIWY